MNHSLHRLIFNASRGQIIAVAETARASGKAASGEGGGGGRSCVPNRPLARVYIVQAASKCIATAIALLTLPAALQAQVVADPAAAVGARPQIFTTASGITQVNIQTPSASGVSRNVYRQFDVGSAGVILNNSAINVQTQLGGWVQGNSNLATPARIILNEVNSSNASQLRGYVEVAGQRAEVIIANPAGIAVNGGGFINASAVTLTTGTPVMNGGALEGYRVTQGSVSVDGAGLDTRGADATRILARAVQVNAGIWVQDLAVVTGANQISADASSTSTLSGNGAAPAVALDVAAIGGMYANKIHLIGTEAGLGVNNAGTLAASSGDLVLSTNGMLTNCGVLDGQTTHVQATEIQNTGTGRIYGDHVAMQAGTINNSAETVAGVTKAGVIAARNRLDIGAQTLTNSEHALILSAGDMAVGGTLDANLQATGSATHVRNGSATIEALGNVAISADTLTNANDHFTYGEQLISTQNGIYESPWANYYRTFNRYNYEPVVTQDDPGQIIAGAAMALTATTLTNQQSKIIAGTTLTVSGTTIANTSILADQRVNDVGTQYSWGVTGGHDDCYPCHWVLNWGYVPSAYNVNTLTSSTVSQGVAVVSANASLVSTTPARSTATATASTTASTLASALFNTPTNPVATYLVETDPRFINQRSWLGSDYMLSALAVDPATVQKRLGDGFYEQRLIREQVGQLTGRRFLGNYTSDEAQYQALMNAGVTYAQAHQLRPGIALSAEQMANLTSDIVWLVEKDVTLPDGRKTRALVPQLYAKVRTDDLAPSGALLGGRSVQLAASGDVLNSGILSAEQLGVQAGNIRNTTGTIQAQVLSLRSNGDITNAGGDIVARQSLDMQAAGNITSSTSTRQVVGANRSELDRQARIAVTDADGTLRMGAGQDITLTAAEVSSAGSAQIAAAGNVKLDTVTTSETFHAESHGEAEFRQHIERSQQTGSTITSNGNLSISAGKDITATAATIASRTDTTLQAGNNIVLQAGQAKRSSDLRWVANNNGALVSTSTDTHIQSSDAVAQRSTVQGQSVRVVAGNTLASVGTEFQASGLQNGSGTLRVVGKEQTLLYETQDVHTSSTTTRSTTSLGAIGGIVGMGLTLEDKTSSDQSATSTAVATRLISTQKVEIGVGTKTELRGTDVEAPQIAFIHTDPTKAGELILGGSTNTVQTAHTEKSETMGLYQEMKGHGSTTQTLNQTSLKGNVSFDDSLVIEVQTPSTAATPASTNTSGIQVASLGAAMAGAQPANTNATRPEAKPSLAQSLQALREGATQGSGLEYLTQLQNRPGVQWKQVQLAHDQWSYDQAGLTPAGAALLTIAVAAATGGAGAELLGGTAATSTSAATLAGSTTLATAVNAGFTVLSSQAAVALVNNRGDIGKTLEQLGKEESLKGVLTAMVTAGALDKLNTSMGWNGVNAQSSFTAQFQKNLTNNLASAGMEAAISDKPFNEESLTKALSSALVSTGMAQGANAIGDAYSGKDGVPQNLNDFTHKVAHAVLGCAGGAATVGNMSGCAPGAVGAVVGELTAEYAKNHKMSDADALGLAKVVAAASGVIVGGGGDNAAAVNVAATTGANAAENNYLAHSEAMARAALKDKQAKGTLSQAEQQQLTNLEVLDIARDLALKDACQTQGDACNAARRDLNAAIGSYATTAAGYNARLSVAGNKSVTAELNQTVAISNDPALAQQTLWDSFKEFVGPQAAGYAAGAVLGKFITEAQAVYAAIKAEAGVVPGTAAGTKLPVATDATATSPYSSSGTGYGKTTLTDANGNPIATQPSLPSAGANGGVTGAAEDAATVVTRPSGGAAAQTLGATREQAVADAVGGTRSGEIIKTTRGRTDVDVIDPAGNLIAVGGPAKADNLGNFVRGLMVYSETATARGVNAYFYYAPGTPQTVIDAATKVLGPGFVKPIP